MADAKIINYGQPIGAGSTAIPDNTSEALDIESTDGGEYITINTTDGGEQLVLGVGPTRPNVMKIKADDGSVSNTTNVGWYLDRADPSATNPVFVPKANDTDTGIGSAGADRLSLIAGGTEALRLGGGGVIGKLETALTGTFTATQGSDVINAGSSTAFETELHVGSAIKIPSDVAAGFEIFTVDGITSDTILSLDSNYLGSTRATSGGAFTDGGELFAVKTGDSKSLFSVNETGAIQAGSAAADGSSANNIAIGDSNALDTITTGTRNIIVGNTPGQYSLTTGQLNILCGYQSGDDLTTGEKNVIIGHDCVKTSSSMQDSVVIGYSAGGAATGNSSVFIGREAGKSVTGANNVAVGHSALDATGSADSSVAVGYQALTAATGNGNTGVGYRAGDTVTSGEACVFLGNDSDGTAGDNNQIAIGWDAVTDGANKVRLGNTSIGNIDGEVVFNNTSDVRTKANIEDLALGLDFINALRPVSFTRVHPADYPAEILDKRYRVGRTETRDVIDEDGNVTGTEEITVSTSTFDVETGQPVKDLFDEVTRSDGLIAQEVQAACDSLGVQFNGINTNSQGKLGLQYGLLVAPLIAAVKELSSQNEALAARIATLEAGD